jgi:predicted nuclease of restriction endonuclease-like (RecB) superfamily
MQELNKNYVSIISDLKAKIRQVQTRISYTANSQLLQLYWEIGNAILESEKVEGWGAKIVEKLAFDLKYEFPEMKGFSVRNLRYMKDFVIAYSSELILQPAVAKLQSIDIEHLEKLQPAVAKLPWTHHTIILDKVKSSKERIFYINKAVENQWNKSVLALQINSKLHLRQGQAITNFDETLPNTHSDLAKEMLKNPYLFDIMGIGEEMQERELEKALTSHIKKFLLELGRGFAYVGNQFNLVVENDDYFLDLLFYNFHLHCFVVFELKVGEFKPEFAGKLNFYINTVDEQIKSNFDKETIGVLLCKTPNETVVKYSLKGIKTPIGVADYEFVNALPKNLKSELPSIEELEAILNKEIS